MPHRLNFRKPLAFCLASLLLPLPAPAQDLAQWRGGWMADVAGVRDVLYLVLRDGKVDSSGLHFSLYRSVDSKAPTIEKVDAVLAQGELQLTVNKAGAAPVK